jgi:hypothetical protein
LTARNPTGRAALGKWVERYEALWRTAGTDGLRELFTEDATYSMAPYEQPYRGLDAIAALWEREREGPDEVFTMASEIVACEGDTGVVRVEVQYGRGTEYRDLWIVQLDGDGRCTHFEEWPFAP